MRLWVISRRRCIVILSLIILVFMGIMINSNTSVPASSGKRDLPIYCVDKGDEKIASISFDAAWGNGIYGLLI